MCTFALGVRNTLRHRVVLKWVLRALLVNDSIFSSTVLGGESPRVLDTVLPRPVVTLVPLSHDAL